ncbi:MAG: hypothetical protein ACI4T2_03310 [Christensenellales bacterium]
MMFRNSVKLLFSNFATVWKLLLYYLVITLIGVGLVAPVFSSVVEVFRNHNFFEILVDLLTTFNLGTNLISIFAGVGTVFSTLVACIVDYFVIHTWLAVYLTFLFVVLLPFLYELGGIAAGETLYGYMSSQAKVNFTGRIFTSLKKSFKYIMAKILVATPINLLVFYLIIKVFELTTLGGTIKFAVPLIITLVLCLLITLRLVLFSGWLPALIVYDCGVWSAFARGIKAVGRRFFRTFSTMLIFVILNICIDVLFGSIAFLLLIPLGLYLIYIVDFVMFYGSQGMRYYVDSDTIISPKRLEEVDKFNNCKDII